jgi:hypothetical protein
MMIGPLRSATRHFFTLLAAPLFLCLSQCSAASPRPLSASVKQCGGKGCTGPSDCLTGMPVCALAVGATCFNGAECTYKLNTGSTSCPCIQHDVRLCMVPGSGAPGVQICIAANSEATSWGNCEACSNCAGD